MNKPYVLKGSLFCTAALLVTLTVAGFRDHQAPALSDALPAQPGETIVKDNLLTVEGGQYSIDGVCKFDSEAAHCWKLDGTPNRELTDSLNRAIQNTERSRWQTYTVTLGKKHRVLVLRETRLRNGASSNGSVYHVSTITHGLTSGWGDSNFGGFNSATSTGFDGSYSTWKLIDGVFDLDAKEFPFRYHFPSAANKKTIKEPLAIGKIDIGGNVMEITAINDHTNDEKSRPSIYFDSRNQSLKPPKMVTEISYKVAAIRDPYTALIFNLADGDGNPIQYVDEKGNPVSAKDVSDWYQKHPYDPKIGRQPTAPYFPCGAFSLDPRNIRVGDVGACWTYLPKSACKNLSIAVSHSDVYIWEHIKLEPNP